MNGGIFTSNIIKLFRQQNHKKVKQLKKTHNRSENDLFENLAKTGKRSETRKEGRDREQQNDKRLKESTEVHNGCIEVTE